MPAPDRAFALIQVSCNLLPGFKSIPVGGRILHALDCPSKCPFRGAGHKGRAFDASGSSTGKRVEFGVEVIEREALQKQKALLVFAGSWFTRKMQHMTANGLVGGRTP